MADALLTSLVIAVADPCRRNCFGDRFEFGKQPDMLLAWRALQPGDGAQMRCEIGQRL